MNIANLQDIKLIYINPFHPYALTNEKAGREIKETATFTIVTKRVKHLGKNLPKETRAIYRKQSNTDERNQRWQIDDEIYHIHESEESIEQKWVYYPK